MHRYGIEEESWFEAARTGLERRGFKLRIQPRSIIIDKESRLPRIVGSAREFLEFAEKQGLRIDPLAFAAADRYGDARADMTGRATPSPFETPPPEYVPPPQHKFGSAPAPDPRRPEMTVVESRLVELRQEQDRQAVEQRVAQLVAKEKAALEQRCAALEAQCATLDAETKRLSSLLAEAEKQRDLYQLSATAAEERLRDVASEYETVPMTRGGDKRFDQLRRFLARELHPDLARPDTPERAVREILFKRVWAKIEQLQ
jgi:hypothetical protein